MHADIIIIGAGPVGVGLAIDLAINGVTCIVVEHHETIQRIPKGQNLTARSGEHFRRWGCQKPLGQLHQSHETLAAVASLLTELFYQNTTTNGLTGQLSSNIISPRTKDYPNMRPRQFCARELLNSMKLHS